MNTFLSLVARDAIQFYGTHLPEVLFILPNKRSASGFQEELARQNSKVIWSPAIYAINDFIVERSGFSQTGDLEGMILLYQSVIRFWKKAGSLVDFMQWGELLIRDFEEVDKYMVEVDRLYTQLSDEKQIESRFSILDEEEIHLFRRFWTGMHSEMSPLQQEWLSLWNQMGPIYRQFTHLQKESNRAGAGLMYRLVAESCQPGSDLFQPYSGVVYIGFNALTRAEEQLFQFTADLKLGRFYWDEDPMLKGPVQRFPMPVSFADLLKTDSHRSGADLTGFEPVQVYSFESSVAQTKMVPLWLDSLKEENHADRGQKTTAIVLGEEGLLDEVLWALDETEPDVNVSIGQSILKTKTGQKALQLCTACIQALSKDLPSSGVVLNAALLGKPCFSELPDAIWQREVFDLRVPGSWKILFHFLKEHSKTSVPGLADYDLKSLGLVCDFLDEIVYLEGRFPAELSAHIWIPYLYKWLKIAKIPYPARPHARIHITGILETRVMDYDHLILLSVSEGIWPAGKSGNSFIPFHLRKEFGLPVIETLDALYGYHFFRLLKRAKHVHIGYLALTEASKMGGGEKSRFLLQWEHERQQEVKQFRVTGAVGARLSDPPVFPKTGQIAVLLEKYLLGQNGGKSVSPSAINTYIDCPLRFVYQNLLRLRDPEELLDLSEPRLFGTLLHEVMEHIYTRLIPGGTITRQALEELLVSENRIYELILEVLENNKNGSFGLIQVGALNSRDLLVLRVIQNYILLILRTDKAYAPFRILGSELQIQREIALAVGPETRSVLLGGIIDRIDQKGTQIRIVDYKSGQPVNHFKELKELIDPAHKNRPKEVLQAVLYSWLWALENGEGKAVAPGLYAMRQMQEGLLNPDISMNGAVLLHQDQYLDGTAELLQQVLTSIFDPTVDFQPTKNLNNCTYCSFKKICQRV